MPEQWTCAMAEEALMVLSVGSLDEAPAPLRAHLAKCAQCTNRVARIRHAERVMHNDLGALRSRHRSDDLAWDVLAISRSERGLWRVPGALRIAGIAAGTSTITAVAAGLLLCLLHPPTTHSASAAPEPHRSTLVLASSSLVLVQDDRVVVVLSSQR